MSDANNNNANSNPGGYCTACGNPLPEGAAFCVNCGAKVGGAPEADAGSGGVEAAGAAEAAAGTPSDVPASAETAVTESIAAPVPASEPAAPAASAEPAVPVVSAATAGGVVPAAPGPAAFEAAAEASGAAAKKPKKTGLIIGIVVAVVVIAAAICAAVFLMGGQSQPDEIEAVQEEQIEHEPEEVVLPYEYETQWPKVENMTYPAFSFRYPNGWEVEGAEVKKYTEDVTLRHLESGVTVRFDQDMQTPAAAKYKLADVEPIAESDFWPTIIQDTVVADRGPFVVAEVKIAPSGTSGAEKDTSYYAVLPESAAAGDTEYVVLGGGVPQFDYLGTIGFYCEIPEGGLSDEIYDQVVAILSSFTNGDDEEDFDRAIEMEAERNSSNSSSSKSSSVPKDGYILKDSNSRYYSESELDDMSMYDLYLARNEIFARHGRIFSNDDLKEYFGGKTWYKGTIEPGDFSDSVLNQYEKKNIELILEMEQEGNSPYLG